MGERRGDALFHPVLPRGAPSPRARRPARAMGAGLRDDAAAAGERARGAQRRVPALRAVDLQPSRPDRGRCARRRAARAAGRCAAGRCARRRARALFDPRPRGLEAAPDRRPRGDRPVLLDARRAGEYGFRALCRLERAEGALHAPLRRRARRAARRAAALARSVRKPPGFAARPGAPHPGREAVAALRAVHRAGGGRFPVSALG